MTSYVDYVLVGWMGGRRGDNAAANTMSRVINRSGKNASTDITLHDPLELQQKSLDAIPGEDDCAHSPPMRTLCAIREYANGVERDKNANETIHRECGVGVLLIPN